MLVYIDLRFRARLDPLCLFDLLLGVGLEQGQSLYHAQKT